MSETKIVTVKIECPGHQYAKVAKEWKAWRMERFGKMVSKYPFFKWRANGMTVECEYIREPDPADSGREMTKEFIITYQGPDHTPELALIREWFEPPRPPIGVEIKKIRDRWNYNISLQEQRGAPESIIKLMEKDREAEIAALTEKS